jgi:thiamine biosynthesis lipoprotein
MGSPCELLCETESAEDAEEFASLVSGEAWRIEDKLSRYIRGNIVDQINTADGSALDVDEETAHLLDFADTLYGLSDGAFDITSGVLRRVWQFDGSSNIPSQEQVNELLGLVGWPKVGWRPPTLQLPSGMEIDLGGIGKEYAVDKAVQILRSQTNKPCLVNFGGDLAVTAPPQSLQGWSVGVESVESSEADKLIYLREGALATSGDARRYLLKNGVRYGHVIDPRSGWPVIDAAASVTVAADTCTQAGMLATLAMLRGPGAEEFLENQAEQYWCYRTENRSNTH